MSECLPFDNGKQFLIIYLITKYVEGMSENVKSPCSHSQLLYPDEPESDW